jgi:Rrf2 family protein
MTVHVSTRCHYAIKALVRLALSYGEGPVQGREIAVFGGIPPKFLEQVMHDLRQAGLVTSRRGKSGGYVLASPPADITFAAVREAIDGSFGRPPGPPPADPAEALVAPVWDDVRMAVRDVLEQATLADAVARYRAADMYYI